MSIGRVSRGRWSLAAGLFGLMLVGPAAAQTSLTVYSDGRVLHRRSLPVRIPAGLSSLTLRWVRWMRPRSLRWILA